MLETDGASFLVDPDLEAELFAPSAMLIRHSGRNQLMAIARRLEGQLTATVHATEQDLREDADLARTFGHCAQSSPWDRARRSILIASQTAQLETRRA